MRSVFLTNIYPTICYRRLSSLSQNLNSMLISFGCFSGKNLPAFVFNLIHIVEHPSAQEMSLGLEKMVIWWCKFWTIGSLMQHFHSLKSAPGRIDNMYWSFVMLLVCGSLIEECWVAGFQSIIYSLHSLSIKFNAHSMTIWDEFKMQHCLEIATLELLFKLSLFYNRAWSLTRTKLVISFY